jgi:hypothetical protein
MERDGANKRSAVEEGGGEPSSGNTADPQLIMLRFWSDANQLFRYASGGEMSRLDARMAN